MLGWLGFGFARVDPYTPPNLPTGVMLPTTVQCDDSDGC